MLGAPGHRQTPYALRRLDRKRRQRQARKARTARRKLQHIHQAVPEPARSLSVRLPGGRLHSANLPPLRRPGPGHHPDHRSPHRLQPLANPRCLGPGHPSSYHRVFSKRRWSSWRLAHGLAGWVFDHFVPEGRISGW